MQKRRSLASAVIAGTALAGVAVLVVSSRGTSFSLLVQAALLGALVESVPARVAEDVKVSLTNVVVFTAMLLGGTGAAVVAGAGAGVATGLHTGEGRVVRTTAFNVGQFALSAFAAGLVYSAMGIVSYSTWQGLLALTIAALIFSLVNRGLVALIVSVTSESTLFATFRNVAAGTVVLQMLYVGLAVLTATLLETAGWKALLLVAVPALVARRALVAFEEESAAYERLVRSLVKALEVKDEYTRGHAVRVAELATETAKVLGLDHEERRRIRFGALLHDIGKIGIPLHIIQKDGPLTDDEFDRMRCHPNVGARMLEDIEFLEPALEIIRHHHERYDGRGYPYGLAGEEIPYLTRIVTAVDTLDAMTSTRSYREALDVEIALEELRRHAGKQFDPEVVDAVHEAVKRLAWAKTETVVPVRAVFAPALGPVT